MAGSRKGEHRGGAKKKGPHEPRFSAKTGTIKPQRAAAPGRVPLITGEREREMLEIITGKAQLMPKDIQLACTRTMFGLAMTYQDILRTALRMLPTKEKPQHLIDLDVMEAERKMVEYLVISSNMARDAAPFVHPKLAALALKTDRNTEGDLFDLLLQEIDETPRLRVIEHRKKEDEEAA